MIELQTGKIIFPELNITIVPLLHYADFLSDFPKNKIIQIRDMRNGYAWCDIREKVYDNKIPVAFCFNPQGVLELVHLYPQSADATASQHWEYWTLEEAQKDKMYCDKWLVNVCGLKNEENLFPWGSVSSYFDPRSCSSGICIHYKEQK
ncbi:MAG: hypothetical protein LUG44_03180 [Clostridiales bacterium]|nr:hypothetical protein [Clostridiales bacterium]